MGRTTPLDGIRSPYTRAPQTTGLSLSGSIRTAATDDSEELPAMDSENPGRLPTLHRTKQPIYTPPSDKTDTRRHLDHGLHRLPLLVREPLRRRRPRREHLEDQREAGERERGGAESEGGAVGVGRVGREQPRHVGVCPLHHGEAGNVGQRARDPGRQQGGGVEGEGHHDAAEEGERAGEHLHGGDPVPVGGAVGGDEAGGVDPAGAVRCARERAGGEHDAVAPDPREHVSVGLHARDVGVGVPVTRGDQPVIPRSREPRGTHLPQ
ncbi:hypothetical protein DFJ74DRAFT_684838, partial [Hyaloraphidium curvatum]